MVIHLSYYDACDVSCDVIYYVIAVRARRMVRIFFLPYLGNHSKSDPCSYELSCLESHILPFPKLLQIPPESPCIYTLYVFVCITEIDFVFRRLSSVNLQRVELLIFDHVHSFVY